MTASDSVFTLREIKFLAWVVAGYAALALISTAVAGATTPSAPGDPPVRMLAGVTDAQPFTG